MCVSFVGRVWHMLWSVFVTVYVRDLLGACVRAQAAAPPSAAHADPEEV